MLSKEKMYLVNGRKGKYELSTADGKSECFFMDDTDEYEYFDSPKIKEINMVSCTYTSVWGCGSEITTSCEYNETTGEITDIRCAGDVDVDILTDEYITLPDGENIQVCQTCHEYTLKTIVGDRPDCSYGEIQVCSDDGCANQF